MTFATFTHANLKHPVFITREIVFYIYYSEANKATHIVSNAGAYIPVVESVEEVKAQIYSLNQNPGPNGGA